MNTYLYRDGRTFEGTPTVIDADRATVMERHKCHRCGGAGGWKGWPGFTCYQCNGSCLGGTKIMKLYSAEKLAKLDATRDKARAKKEAARLAAAEVRKAEQRAEFADWLESYDGKGATDAIEGLRKVEADMDEGGKEIMASIVGRYDDHRPLTEKQIEVLVKMRHRTDKMIRERATSRYAAEVGETITIEGDSKLIWEDPWGPYGWKGIFTIKTTTGIVAKYSGSKSLGNRWVKLTATVKAHEEYKGVKQTVITRPRKIEAVY